MTGIPFLVVRSFVLGCQGDENPYRDDRADHAEEYGGSSLRLRDAVLQGEHDHYRHGWNGGRQHCLADNEIAIAEPSQTIQHHGGLHDVLQEYEETCQLILILPDAIPNRLQGELAVRFWANSRLLFNYQIGEE